MNPWFPEIKKNFGFGAMRLPMISDKVDIPQTTKMVDTFMARGFNYFDTAHGYINGQSETALKECLTSRYPRDSYILTNKLSGYLFETKEQILPMFQQQLDACGVEYFDFRPVSEDLVQHFGGIMEGDADVPDFSFLF